MPTLTLYVSPVLIFLSFVNALWTPDNLIFVFLYFQSHPLNLFCIYMVIYCLYRSVWPASCFFFLRQRRNCKAGDGVSMSIPTSLCPLIIDCCVLTPNSRCACACLKLIALWSIMNEYGCTQNIYQRHRWSWLLMLNIWSCLKAIKPMLNTSSSTSAGSWICQEQRHRNTFAGGVNQNKNPARRLSRYTPVVSGDWMLLSLAGS